MSGRISRRDFLAALGLGAATGCASPGAALLGETVNDVHSQLNATRVRGIETPGSVDELVALMKRASREGRRLSLSGGRHAMGGQQFLAGELLVDTRGLNRVLKLDVEGRAVEVEAGIQWPGLVAALYEAQAGLDPARAVGILQKQTGADRMTLGGALAANIHGRGLRMKPIVGDVESFTLVTPSGDVLECSRTRNEELFRLAIGGYGLFGAIATVRLRLGPRHKVRRDVRVITGDEVLQTLDDAVAAGAEYGDFQFSIDDASDDFLRRGICSTYTPVPMDTPVTAAARELREEDWSALLLLAHTNKAEAYRQYVEHYVATHGNVYWSDLHQLAVYPEGYHQRVDRAMGKRGSEMITELYVPREQLPDFLFDARRDFLKYNVSVVYGTVRLIEQDDETFLPWARERFACVVFNIHVPHDGLGVDLARETFRRLIALAILRGGSYYLTYHRDATRDQVLACHPRMPEFLRKKQAFDPKNTVSSDWHEAMVRLLRGA